MSKAHVVKEKPDHAINKTLLTSTSTQQQTTKRFLELVILQYSTPSLQ